MTKCREVLVVDDDGDIRASLSELLEDEGYRAPTAINGVEALDRLRQGVHPCVILLDLMMPVMNGLEFRALQKADPELAGIPVVIISAHARPADVDADAFLSKPVSVDRLLAVVERFCPGP